MVLKWAGEKIVMGENNLEKTEILGWAGDDAIVLEEQDEGSLMVEVTPSGLGQRSARLFLNDAGIKSLREFLNK